MSKPNKDRISTNASEPLTHNPFAAFGAAFGAALDNTASQAPSPEPEPCTESSGKKAADHATSKPGRVVLRKETAHRGGKSVIVVDDFAAHLSLDFIEELAKKLRKSCGCGGAVKGRSIELQGDQPKKIRALLEAEGFRVAGI